jgi:hypothetical protein
LLIARRYRFANITTLSSRIMRRFAILFFLCGGPSACLAADNTPTLLCRGAIASAEFAQRIPDQFLNAIARVESGRGDIRTSWPWTVNAEGVGHFYDSKAEAIAAVMALQARGISSIDVGCLQVNLSWHKDAFVSLDQAFDPIANANYGAQYLKKLFADLGSWPLAAAAYHSQTADRGTAYLQKVLAAWATPQDRDTPAGPTTTAPAASGAKPVLSLFTSPFHAAVATAGAIGAFGALPAHTNLTTPRAALPPGQHRDLAAYRRMAIPMALPMAFPTTAPSRQKQG